MAICIAIIVLAVPLVLWLCFKWGILDPRWDRSGEEVVEMLQSFLEGNSNVHDFDDFECIPIKNPTLDEIRARFVQLAEECPNWDYKKPFPLEGKAKLESMIEQAKSAAS